jgi:hypothetical protein
MEKILGAWVYFDTLKIDPITRDAEFGERLAQCAFRFITQGFYLNFLQPSPSSDFDSLC